MGCFNGFLCFDGVEFVNAARDFHYMNTMGHRGIVGPINTSCICDGLTPAGTLAASIRITGEMTEENGVSGVVSSEGAPLFIYASAVYIYGSYVVGTDGPCGLPSIPAVDSPSWVDVPVSTEALPAAYTTRRLEVSPGSTVDCYLYRVGILDADDNVLGYIFTIYAGSNLRYFAATSELGGTYPWADPTDGDLIYEFSASGPGGAWSNPADDDVWWYDAAVPASADVVGLWIEDVKISAPMKREVKERLWGASIGSPVYGKREVVITGWVLTKSASATSYMRQAIHELLVGDDNCGGCSPPDLTYWETCPTEDDRHVRKILQCGLTQLDWEVEPSFDYAQGSKFIATLTSEIPWIAKEPATVYEAPALDSVPICNICNPCPSSSTVDLSCGCLTESVQVVPEPDRFGCYHAPITVARSCILISPTILWGQGVINLEIYAGLAHNADGSGLRNMRVRGWPNPDGLGVDSASIVCTDPCIDIEIACLPAGSTLTIDSMKRRAKIVKDGRESRGVRYLSSSDGGIFRWPEFSCAGLYLCIDADGTGTSDTATVRIETQEFERA